MTHPAHTPASQHTRLPPAGATGRALRARTEPMTVRPLRDRRYVVETEGGTYVVDLDRRTCTCPDHAIRGSRCKHLRRVAIEVTERHVPAPGERPAVCAVCGRETFVPFDATGAQLCERHVRRPGDVAVDRERGATLLVVGVTTARADAVETHEGRLVADYESNRHYGSHEPVVDAVYLEDDEPRKRYRFPASRLRPRRGADETRPEPRRGRALPAEDEADVASEHGGDARRTPRREGGTPIGVGSTA
ncbi:SWIM zinc finger family protein [Salinigranum sp.]|uniref:SWIM zinc finger family protein n=1 Tax=Salinigranum sp. TaxID=1966351 RepID=UPI0035691AAA